MPVLVLNIRVKPNARASVLHPGVGDGPWLAEIKAAPVDGKANEALVALVASHFGCRKSAVTIKSGAASRLKRVRVDAP